MLKKINKKTLKNANKNLNAVSVPPFSPALKSDDVV